MIIAIAGSQGTGKSTLIQELSVQHNIPHITRKTSRSILTDWNVSLSEVNNSRELTIMFQEEILSRKIVDEDKAAKDDAVWLTERTYADLFTYAVVAVGKDNEYSDWLDDYYARCCAAQLSYDGMVYLTAGHFQPVHDGVRGTNVHYSRMVDMMMRDYTGRMWDQAQAPLIIMSTPHMIDRVNTVASIANSLKQQRRAHV